MKKLTGLGIDGGMFLDSEDFDYVFDEDNLAFAALGSALAGAHSLPDTSGSGPRFVILTGGVLSYTGSSVSGTFSWTAGWAFIEDELRRIPAGSKSVTWASTTGITWAKKDVAEGPEVFEDGGTFNTYLDQQIDLQVNSTPIGPAAIPAWVDSDGVITSVFTGGQQSDYFLPTRLAEQVYEKLKAYEASKGEAWTAVTFGTNWTTSGLGNNLSWRYNMDGTVTVSGLANLTGSPASLVGSVVASGLPKLKEFNAPTIKALFFPVNGWEDVGGVTVRPCNVRIDQSGDLIYYGPTSVPSTLLLPIHITYPYDPTL